MGSISSKKQQSWRLNLRSLFDVKVRTEGDESVAVQITNNYGGWAPSESKRPEWVNSYVGDDSSKKLTPAAVRSAALVIVEWSDKVLHP